MSIRDAIKKAQEKNSPNIGRTNHQTCSKLEADMRQKQTDKERNNKYK